jgi:hypothetical protein
MKQANNFPSLTYEQASPEALFQYNRILFGIIEEPASRTWDTYSRASGYIWGGVSWRDQIQSGYFDN